MLSNAADKKMVVAVYSHVQIWEVHHADTIELVHRLSDEGKRVLLVSCDGELSSCPANPSHDEKICKRCRKITSYTESKLLCPDVVPLRLQISEVNNSDKKIGNLNTLLSLNYINMPVGSLVASQIADDERGEYINLNNETTKSKCNKHINNAIALYESAAKLIKEYNVKEVYSWNGRRPSDGPPLYAATNNGADCYAYISGGKTGYLQVINSHSVQDFNARKKDIDRRTKLLSDNNKSDEIKKTAMDYYEGYLGGNLDQVGYRDFSTCMKENVNLVANKPILLVVTSSPKEHIHQPAYQKIFGDDPYGIFLNILNSEEVKEKYEIIIRWHPANRSKESNSRNKILQLIKQYAEFKHYAPESNVDTYHLLDQSDVVLSTGSTVSHVACIKRKPVVVFGPASVLFGKSVYPATDVKTARELLLSKLVPQPADDLFSLAYYNSNFGDLMRHVHFNSKRSRWVLKKKSGFIGYKEESIHPMLLIFNDYIKSRISRILNRVSN